LGVQDVTTFLSTMTRKWLFVSMVALGLTLSSRAFADPAADAKATVATFVKTDPDLKRLLDSAAGYAVFPSIGKAAVGIGGANGKGVLFEKGTPTHRINMTQVTVGLALGGQTFSQVILFENESAVRDFKRGTFELAANASAVALSAGASKAARYRNGILIFTATKSGLMFEASVGGQKFTLSPL
jgi:lipid-binding SYLF domain-containing protein